MDAGPGALTNPVYSVERFLMGIATSWLIRLIA